MIIDIHGHPYFDEPRQRVECIDGIVREARRLGIDRLALLGNVVRFGFRQNARQVRLVNDLTLAMQRRHPDFLIGFCFLNPKLDRPFLAREIERSLEGGLRGIKLECDVDARDRRLDFVMQQAMAYDVPVMQHTWYKTVQKVDGESSPADLADLARRFPKATIIMAHLSGGGMRGIMDVQRFPNVCVDTSGGQPVAGLVEYAVKHLGAERVLFGSDAPLRDFATQLGRIHGARLTAAQRRLILGGNAVRLLKIRH